MANGLAHRQHFFDSAFADQLVRLILLGDYHRHTAAGEVERNLVNLVERCAHVQFAVHFHMLQHRHVQQVFQAGLVVAVQVGHFQHVVGLFTPHIHMARQEDFVLGQGPGFIGAQHVHRAKVLDSVQTFDDDFFARQKHRALGQGRGHDHRQHFRGQAHRHRQREQQRFSPVTFGKTIDEQHQRRHHKHKADQQPADLVNPGLERSRPTIGGPDTLGQCTKVSVITSGQDHSGGGAGHHVGAHEQNIFQLQRVDGLAVRVMRKLLHRHRLTSHGRLADKQILGAQYPAIGRDHVPCRQHDQVTRNQLFDRQLNALRTFN